MGPITGAILQKKGKLEVANGGTVFLDEIGELAPSLQAKLLRVMQELEFERVGGTRPIKVDVRVVAAASKNLKEEVSSGAFREDLFYRFNVVLVEIPPLRERREDIPLLAIYFASKDSYRCKRTIGGVSPEARECLMNYSWRGNVRELENAIERAEVLGSGDLAVTGRIGEGRDAVTRRSSPLDLIKRDVRRGEIKAVQDFPGGIQMGGIEVGQPENGAHSECQERRLMDMPLHHPKEPPAHLGIFPQIRIFPRVA